LFYLKLKEAGNILQKLHLETIKPANRLRDPCQPVDDELILLIGRKADKQNNYTVISTNLYETGNDPPSKFSSSVAVKKWQTGSLGTTSLLKSKKVYRIFTLNYLITIRISKPFKLLKKPDLNVRESHGYRVFSRNIFHHLKKLTGYTPSEFRRETIQN